MATKPDLDLNLPWDDAALSDRASRQNRQPVRISLEEYIEFLEEIGSIGNPSREKTAVDAPFKL